MDIAINCAHTEVVDASTLVPNPRNPNQHSKKQIELLAKIIQRQGWRAPITVSNRSGFVVRGHGRLQAALLLGCAAPVDRQDYASEAEEWADLIADNRIAELAELDGTLLAELLREIGQTEIDPSLTGYSARQIDNLLANLPQEEIRDDNFDAACAAKEAAKAPRSKRGDLWQLGRHRLLCGDSTSRDDVAALMGGALAEMVFTDPPYNVAYEGGTKDKLKIKNDDMPAEEFQRFLTSAFLRMYEAVKPGGAIYVCHADSAGSDFRAALAAGGWSVRQCLIWVKNQLVIGKSDYQWQHEPILYGWRDGAAHRWYGGRRQGTTIDSDLPVVLQDAPDGTTLVSVTVGLQQLVLRVPSYEIVSAGDDAATSIWRFDKPVKNSDHPTMKPIPLCARAIQNSSRPQEIVLDLFGGSGSTLMAAEQTGRICYTMELDPVYADVIIARWEAYTGQQAVLLVS